MITVTAIVFLGINTVIYLAQMVFEQKLKGFVSEDAMGGVEKRGGRKSSRMTPLPKGVLDPPSYPKDPAVLKILRRSEFTMRSDFTMAQGFIWRPHLC